MSTTAVTESPAPLYATAMRWKQHLTEKSVAYRRLQAERELGWRSAALDSWYSQRRDEPTSEVSVSAKRQREPEGENSGPASSSEASAATTTAFATAHVGALAERYREHAARILRGYIVPHAGTDKGRPTFLDLGAAPGGVSKFFVQDLQWSGVGVTLPLNSGGIAMDASLLASGTQFQLVEGDVSQPPSTWAGWPSISSYDFVNGGAVADYGQRAAAASTESNPRGPILPWMELFVPQLRLALEKVRKDGKGSMMLVYGAPHCASFFILLFALSELVAAECGTKPAYGPIHVFSTMHWAKPPVYVLLPLVHLVGKGAAQQQLLDALDAQSPVLFPCSIPRGAGGSSVNPAPLEGLDGDERRRAKAAFWLGETEEGWLAAAEGFRRFHADVEKIWNNAERLLRNRRTRAEEAIRKTSR